MRIAARHAASGKLARSVSSWPLVCRKRRGRRIMADAHGSAFGGLAVDYVSTRGSAPVLRFRDVLLAGLARDGGLYVPRNWPRLSPEEIGDLAGGPFTEVAHRVLTPFTQGEIAPDALRSMIEQAYREFRHKAVAPLVQIAPNQFILELFHGPTLAFKDVAMQLLARLMDHVLRERGERATIVGATSGDTGGAAIAAFGGRDNVDVFILFPRGKVSPVQQRQMTTSGHANVHALAVEGTFDDCQSLVKALFNDHDFRDRVGLGGVNSINWARIMAQIVYYFTAATSLGAPLREVSFAVPTANFGDIFAGLVAKRMGLPIKRLVIATNANDILARTIATGRCEPAGVEATTSPSMDIQISSNFERLVFEACGRDASEVRRLMDGLRQSGAYTLPAAALEAIRAEFSAGSASEPQIAAAIKTILEQSGYLLDPHTAAGWHVAQAHLADEPMITLATAHPAKFPDAVHSASGVRPTLPAWLGDLMERKEAFEPIANDLESVQRQVLGRRRQDGKNQA